MSNFLNYLKAQSNLSMTTNGAYTHSTTGSKVLDYFAQGSALRNRSIEDIEYLFEESFKEEPLLTLKVLFYSRDVRGGQGERETFRRIIRLLASNHTEILAKNLHLIPEFGRWDDLFVLLNSKLHHQVIALISKQLMEDCESNNPSLLGKWMKSENTSSHESRKIATILRKSLDLTPRNYRLLLTNLRKKIDIVESKLSSKNYSEIQFEKLPSNAMLKYKKAFARNCEHYSEYLEKLSKGETKVNVKALYPYELVRSALSCYGDDNQRSLLNSMWSNIPDYIGDNNTNLLSVIDVSGSMEGTPMYMAISLGLYIAERNKGIFGNHFITFHNYPLLEEIKGEDFVSKVQNIHRADWGGSTNLERTFDLILNTAIKHNLKQEELPEKLFIISDMEFDECEGRWGREGASYTTMEIIEQKFNSHGYKVPKLVFWNVNSVQNNIPKTDDGVQLVSGANPIIFENLLKGESLDAYDLMLLEIGKPRYDVISI